MRIFNHLIFMLYIWFYRKIQQYLRDTYFWRPAAMSFSRCSSNLSLANLRKISESTTCLYSAGSTLPRNLFADSQREASTDFSIFFFLLFVEFFAMLKIYITRHKIWQKKFPCNYEVTRESQITLRKIIS